MFAPHATRSRRRAGAWFLVLLLWSMFQQACEQVSHESIDRWGRTKQGPAKLLDALNDSDLDSELRSHAAVTLVEIGRLGDVLDAMKVVRDSERSEVISKLIPRLWEMARVLEDMAVPTPQQVAAKDALYQLLDYATPELEVQIDRYLIEWLAGGHFEGRATMGNVSAATIVRRVGQGAASQLLDNARQTREASPDKDGRRLMLGQEILRALALTGSPKALEFLFELVREPRGDVALPARVLRALHEAYVEPRVGPLLAGAPLAAVLDELWAVQRDRRLPGTMRNDALALLAAVGMPACLPGFVELIRRSRGREPDVWIGVQHGARCAGVAGLKALAEALPTSRGYSHELLSKYFWDEIRKANDAAKMEQGARTLLTSGSWVARISGIELLDGLGRRGDATENAKLIRGLRGDSHRLTGWFGTRSGAVGGQKSAPKLGDVALRVANRLEELAKGTTTER